MAAGAMLTMLGASVLSVPFYGFLPLIVSLAAIGGLAVTGRLVNRLGSTKKDRDQESRR